MGEPIWVNVQVAWPKRWGGQPDDHPYLDMLDSALGETFDQADHQVLIGGVGNYGRLDDDLRSALGLLELRGWPYMVTDETKYDMPGSCLVFDGIETRSFPVDNDGDAILPLADVDEILASDDPAAELTRWREMVRPLDFAAFAAACPDEPPQPCDECGDDGYLVGQTYDAADIPDDWVPVQRCDACGIFDGDDSAADAYAAVRRRHWLGPRPVAFFYSRDTTTYDPTAGDFAVQMEAV